MVHDDWETDVDEFVSAIRPHAASVDVTQKHHDHYVIDFRLEPAATDPFASSVEYFPQLDEVRNPVLRFSDDLRQEYSITYLRKTFEEMVATAAGPDHKWKSYPMGDVGTGPHVTSFDRVDADAFLTFLDRLMDEYDAHF